MESEWTIRTDRRAGDDALIVALHRSGYASEGPRFGEAFAAFVGETVAEAQLDRPHSGTVWFAERAGQAHGCAAMVYRGDKGQLRWVVLDQHARGQGLGQKLVNLAMEDARARGFRSVFLETTDGLAASMAIYESLGFVVVSDEEDDLWHGRGRHIIMELELKG